MFLDLSKGKQEYVHGKPVVLAKHGRITRDSIWLGSADLDMSIPSAVDCIFDETPGFPKINMLGFRLNILAWGPFFCDFWGPETYFIMK